MRARARVSAAAGDQVVRGGARPSVRALGSLCLLRGCARMMQMCWLWRWRARTRSSGCGMCCVVLASDASSGARGFCARERDRGGKASRPPCCPLGRPLSTLFKTELALEKRARPTPHQSSQNERSASTPTHVPLQARKRPSSLHAWRAKTSGPLFPPPAKPRPLPSPTMVKSFKEEHPLGELVSSDMSRRASPSREHGAMAHARVSRCRQLTLPPPPPFPPKRHANNRAAPGRGRAHPRQVPRPHPGEGRRWHRGPPRAREGRFPKRRSRSLARPHDADEARARGRCRGCAHELRSNHNIPARPPPPKNAFFSQTNTKQVIVEKAEKSDIPDIDKKK